MVPMIFGSVLGGATGPIASNLCTTSGLYECFVAFLPVRGIYLMFWGMRYGGRAGRASERVGEKRVAHC